MGKEAIVKELLAVLVLALGAVVSAIVDPGPAPKIVPARPYTSEEIKQGLVQERKQIKYDVAENVAARVLRRHGCDDEFAEVIGHAAVDEGLNPRVIAATVVVESTCNPALVSRTGDVGLMQVNARIHHLPVKRLLDPIFNVEAGGHFLASCIHKFGVTEGLHRYNGLGNPTNEYANRVLKAAGYII